MNDPLLSMEVVQARQQLPHNALDLLLGQYPVTLLVIVLEVVIQITILDILGHDNIEPVIMQQIVNFENVFVLCH